MSDDKKVISLVTPAQREDAHHRKEVLRHLDEAIADIKERKHKFMLATVGEDGATSMLTDLELFHANYVVDKLKFELVAPVDGFED